MFQTTNRQHPHRAERTGWPLFVLALTLCLVVLSTIAWTAPWLGDGGRAALVGTTAVGIAAACTYGFLWKVERSFDKRNTTDRRHEQARLAAETSNREKSEFLANMSREVRTPLNGILGYTELLIRGADNGSEKERLELLTAVRDSGRQLLQLINDILDISTIESGHFRVETVPYSPNQILSEVVSALKTSAEHKGLTLDYRWESRMPDTIRTDPQRLKQLLMNLVGNAIKFTDAGNILVLAAIDDTSHGPKLRLEVHDTGIGVPANKLDSLFNAFAQVDATVTRKNGGTGLGLAISKKIASALGGALSVQSQPGAGSVFVATVATGDLYGIRFTDPASVPQVLPSSKPFPVVRLDGKRVLVVDDTETNRRLVQLFLTRAGATVATAENGALGVEQAERGSFDVILMDMQMPIMDGYTATTLLRERGYDGPIIALTAHAMHGDREKCEAAGCSGYISKPINMDDLTIAVRETIGTKYAPPASPPGDRPAFPTPQPTI